MAREFLVAGLSSRMERDDGDAAEDALLDAFGTGGARGD
jgi:hypothetical protein